MKKVGEESLSSRDDFIAAMISELNKQKISQGNNSQFVTGGFLSASEVFRKLCFDYPLVDDQALQILVVGLKTVRQSNKSVEFRHSFFVHEKFLDNITYLIQDIEHQGKEMNHDDSDNEEEEKSKSLNFTNASIQADQKHNNSTNSTPEPSKRGKVLAIVAAEIYLHYPSYLMKLTKRELTSFLSTDGSHLFSTIPMGRVLDDLHWLDVITRFRNYILKSNVTLIATSTDANTLISNGSMTALLDCIASLQHLIDIVSPNKRADNLHNNTTTTKKSSITKANDNMNIVEYLEGQFTMYVNRKEAAEKDQKTVEALEGQESTPEGSTLPPSEEDLQAEQLLAMIKEIWTHLIYLYIDTLCRIPDLLASQFMPLSDTLFQFPKKTATGPATMEDLFLFNNKQKAGPSLPLPNQYLGLMMISNISNYLTKEMELGRHPTLLRVVKEDIRKYYGGNSNEMLLTQVVEICEHIRDYNQQQVVGVIEKDTASKVKPPIDLESTNFLLDIAELLMYSDRYSHVTSTVANAIMTKFISSRLLASLMNVYVHILQVYQQLMQTSEADATQPANATAQLWLVSCR